MEKENDNDTIQIIKAEEKHASLLSELATKTFLESHGHSAAPQDINFYVTSQYNKDRLREKLADPKNLYSIILCNNEPAGFSNIILNARHSAILQKDITELDKLYVLQSYHGLQLGHKLINYAINTSKASHQSGMWLFTWKENSKAIAFYTKQGFEIIGSYNFKISETHYNPNHLMWLKY